MQRGHAHPIWHSKHTKSTRGGGEVRHRYQHCRTDFFSNGARIYFGYSFSMGNPYFHKRASATGVIGNRLWYLHRLIGFRNGRAWMPRPLRRRTGADTKALASMDFGIRARPLRKLLLNCESQLPKPNQSEV